MTPIQHRDQFVLLGKVLLPDHPTIGEGLVERLRSGIVPQVGGVERPEDPYVAAQRDHLAGR